MEKLTMCRICLVENVSMYEVQANKDLQEMYEKLTDIPFVTEDCRPVLACFFCYAKLKQCCRLLRKCLIAEEAFAQRLNGDIEQIPLEPQGTTEFCGGLIITSIEYMSIGANTEQLPAVGDIKDEIERKEEYLTDEDEEEMKYLADCYLAQEDIASYQSELDSEDDVPLLNFKTAVTEEPEVLEKNTRAPEAKKPKIDTQKATLEDKIIDKQMKNKLPDSKVIYSTTNETFKSVTKFKEPIIRIAKLNDYNRISNKDKETIDESLNRENVKEVLTTATDTNYRNNSYQDHLGCKIFNDKDINRDDTNMHKKMCRPYTCDICKRSFNQKRHLSDHFIWIHTGKKPYECDICQRSYSRKDSLRNHIRTHSSEKPYKCEICQLSFTYKHSVNKHILKHTGEKPYKCDICQRGYTLRSNMNSHIIRVHTGKKPYKCDICLRSFSAKSNMYTHIRTHVNEKPYKCDICQRSFTQKGHLKSHHKTHFREKPYKCETCQCSFNRKVYLVSHLRTHTGKKPYECDVCQRSFTQKSHLESHHRTHTGEKPYKCDVCQRSFTLKGHLKSHHRIHTGEKPYKCDVCQQSFNQIAHLKSHRHTHFDEKPYKCDICQRSFTQKVHLELHHRTHTGEKPYKCDVCQRSFTQKVHLELHHRTHTGEKPYKCDVCNRSFIQKAHLKSHHRRHIGEKS